MLDFVLRLAGAQCLRQVMPVFEQPHIEHGENTADVARAFLVEIHRSFGRVEIAPRRAVALAAKKLHCHEGIKEVGDTSRVKVKLGAQFVAWDTTVAQFREKAHLDRGEEHFGIPEGEGSLQDG